jgi:hypothetical protein
MMTAEKNKCRKSYLFQITWEESYGNYNYRADFFSNYELSRFKKTGKLV